MQARTIGPFTVSALGLGCMNLSHAYGTPPTPEQGEHVLRQALDAGVTLFDTAALYGFGANEELLGRVLAPHRQAITLCSKGGMFGQTDADGVTRRVIDGQPHTLQRNCEDSLRRLRTDCIDLYYLHRWDQRVPIEDSVGALARLLEQGKIRAIGLSEVSATTLRRAHAVHPVAAVQTEYSLWTRNPEIAVLAACRELGVALVPFSPLGRGYLTGQLRDPTALTPKDIRRGMPRFQAPHYTANLALLAALEALASELGHTPGQLALAWLLAQGPDIVPIPGTTRVEHLISNVAAAGIALTPAQLQALGTAFDRHRISGERYPAATQREIDTEDFPA